MKLLVPFSLHDSSHFRHLRMLSSERKTINRRVQQGGCSNASVKRCQEKVPTKGLTHCNDPMQCCFLKRSSNLTITQVTKLRDLLKYNLKSVRALALKESFDAFWQYESPRWARWYLAKWCTRAMRSKLEPMKKFVRTLRNHEDLLMNYFKAGKLYNSGIVEGVNLRINLCMRKANGYRSFDLLQISLYHSLGDLPEPKSTHKFC
jgi:transposase